VSDPKRDNCAAVEDPDSIGTLEVDPELQAALEEAAASVPDPTPGESEKEEKEAAPAVEEAAPTVEEATRAVELLLDDAVEETEEVENARLQKEVTEANDKLLRLQADFDNFRKRAQRERMDALQYGSQNLVKDLLSVVDNLERAIDHAQKSEGGDLQSFLQGVELVKREFLGVLGNHGVAEIEASGKLFDPALHEAMAQVPVADTEPNTIVDVLQKGYQLRDRLVRASRVVVAKAPEPGEGGEGEATE